ncbi:interleukin-12 subunit beta [Scleropages formosus]|uniref:interleukin-12 subunit beta n=1 Tax=Scleropages formosus TaxID=113540 RepID=UPI0010FA88A4|nr:interleukin-12 subunit beta-like [Scleropages formosus]
MILGLQTLLLFLLQTPGGSSQHSEAGYWFLQPNVLVVNTDLNIHTQMQIPLSCGEAYEGQEVFWRNEGQEIDQQGNHIQVTVEELTGGNYSCHDSNGSFLNHTLVLVQLLNGKSQARKILDKVENTDYIQCTSRNYSGIFHCSWKWSEGRRGDLFFAAVTRSSGQSNISCAADADRSGMICLDRTHCPYTEELHPIDLTIYVKYWYRVEKYTKQFYIAGIVKPDRVRLRKAHGNTFEWEYPSTWNIPDSFFPLHFEVKVAPLNKDCDAEGEQSRVQVIFTEKRTFSVSRRKNFLFCVRSQDTLTKSGWSEWEQRK